MKTSRWICATLALASVNLYGQTASPRPRDTPYAITSRNANSRAWTRTNWTQGASGEWVPHVHKVTELATGLCHKDGNGNYVDSSEAITLLPDGTAAATNCATAVFLPADIGSGVIRLVTSDGKVLQNGPAYLAFDDGRNAIMIAAVTNSVGQLISSNQVLYPDIFRGEGLRADLLCTVRKSGFESDVVFREQIPDPASVGLGTNARVELLTEWFDTPEPTQTTNAPSKTDGLGDVTLHFGSSATIGRGKAFATETSNSKAARSKANRDTAPVYKSWIHSKGGQAFLVESVPYRHLAPKLKQLPARADAAVKRPWHKLFTAQELPSRPRWQASAKSIQVAKADPGRGMGVVLDYTEVNGDIGDYTFSPGTYFVSGPTYCGNGIIQGGAIFKYSDGTGSFLQIDSVTCQTGPYNPAIFTAADDDSVGDSINGSSGNPFGGGYANPALLVNTATLHDLRIRYVQEAIVVSTPANLTVKDTQIAGCQEAFSVDGADNCSITLENCLIGDAEEVWYAGTVGFEGNGSCSINLYNCTLDYVGPVVDAASLYSVNSIFSVSGGGSGSLSGGYNGFDGSSGTFGDHPITSVCDSIYDPPYFNGGGNGAYDFGVGNYYLACPNFRNAGTSDPNYVLDPSVLADIATKTTQPPSESGYSTYSANVTLGIVNPGDTSPTPDLGYHYDRLDYAFSEVTVAANLTFSPGTAVGWCIEPSYQDGIGLPQYTGIWLNSGASITFQGSETSPCHFVDCRTVWDFPDGYDVAGAGGRGIVGSSPSSGPSVNATFTRFCSVDNRAGFFGSSGNLISVSGNNCEFWNGSFCEYNTGLTLNLFNCLLDEPGLEFMSGNGAPACSLTLNNCTLTGWYGFLVQRVNSAWPINIKNCAFDGYMVGIGSPYSGNISCDYNAYIQGSPRTKMAGTHDVLVSSGFNWQPGPLGNFYLPNDAPAQDGTLLIDAGNQSAETAGLFHYTTQVNQAIEGNTPVDIGYHYVALGPDGNPPTTGVQGIPDYQLDSVLPSVSITAPANNSTFNTASINVSGTFTEQYLKQITVNGVPAFISGNTFQALGVPLPLQPGANTITATIVDLFGKPATASVTVNESSATPVVPVQLTATPVAGFAPLAVTFQVTANVPGVTQVLYDFNGDGIVDQTEGNLTPVTYTYSTGGQNFPVVTVVTSAGSFSSSGGWNSTDPNRLRVNVQSPPLPLNNPISVTDPVDVKCDSSGNLYVLCGSTATILEYNSSQTLLRSLANIGTTPTGLDVDASGNVYVAVNGDNQVLKFNPAGSSFQPDTTFGNGGHIGKDDKSTGTGNGQFSSPYDVAVSRVGTQIAVSDSGNNRIQQFTSGGGAYVSSFGQQGSGNGQFNSPKGLTYDSLGYLYVVDSGNNRVGLAFFSSIIGTSGGSGTGLGQFQGPINVGVGSRAIYVADTGNNRVQQFDLISVEDGASGVPFNPQGVLSAELSLNQPSAVATTVNLSEEDVYIADTGNNRVILVKLPIDSPAAVWDAMKQKLLSDDIAGAVPYFSSVSKNKYRAAFASISASDLNSVIGSIPEISPVVVGTDTAQYRFDVVINGVTITFPIDFVKENGQWTIENF